MADRESLERMLEEGLKKEKVAADNCDKILKELEINGNKPAIEKIKNDEIEHQKIVQKLIDMLK